MAVLCVVLRRGVVVIAVRVFAVRGVVTVLGVIAVRGVPASRDELSRQELHPAFRAVIGCIADDLGVHRTGVTGNRDR